MDSAVENVGTPLQHGPLVDLSNKLWVGEASKQFQKHDAIQVVSLELQYEPAVNMANELVQRDVEDTKTKREVTIVFPDVNQVPLSCVAATGIFQLSNDSFNHRTAEIAANSPRYRRRSSTFIDGVHDLPDEKASPMAPAQLYSTMSGRLFHSGRIAIVLVGPPARGKT